MNPHTQPALPVPPWHAALVAAGYQPASNGYRRNGITVAFDAPWLVLTTAARRTGDDADTEDLGRPGIWKTQTPRGGRPISDPGAALPGADRDRALRRVFAIPCSLLEEEEETLDGEEGVLGSCLRWAEWSVRDERPKGWLPPSRESVLSWIPKAGLTVQNGPLLHQGELRLSEDRWTVRFCFGLDAATNVEPGRAAWLRRITSAGHRHWRMIRVGCHREEERLRLIAEFDLTGAPHSPVLLRTGLETLREAVRWLGPVAEVLTDPQVDFPEPIISFPKTHKT